MLWVGLRALAALRLAAGVFLLPGSLGVPSSSGGTVAGAAFLVGLYAYLTLKTRGGLADRLHGRVSGGEDGSTGVPHTTDLGRRRSAPRPKWNRG